MSATELDNLASAQIQHSVAVKVRRAILRAGLTIEDAAAENNIDYGRLGRLLRGDIIMRLEDVAWADRTFNLRLLEALVGAGDAETRVRL